MSLFRIDVVTAQEKLSALSREERQDILNRLGALAELADEAGSMNGFGPRANLWTECGRHRVLYQVDSRKRALYLIDLMPVPGRR